MINYVVKYFVKIWYFLIKKDRIAYARHLGVRWGKRGKILEDPERVFGSEPWLITLGDDVYITYGVRFITHNGNMWCARNLEPSLKNDDVFNPINVGNNVSIGLNVVVMPGVSIGDNVVVGSNCVVTKNIEPNSVVAGVPGRRIGSIDELIGKIKSQELVSTKNMSKLEKKQYLSDIHPEWFK